MANKIKYPIIDGKKECGDCHEWKPIDQYKKARNHLTSRCVSCIKVYSSNYRNREDIKIKSRLYHKDYIAKEENKIAKNKYKREWSKLPHAKEKKNCNRREWAAKEKQKAVDYKGGACCMCGYNSCLAALDFHHTDPSTKEGYGGGALKSHWSFEKNKPELDKCILVCVRCHREIHAGVYKND